MHDKGSPGRRSWLSRLPLYSCALNDVFLHGHLDLCWYIWRGVTDFNSCLQEAKVACILQLVCHGFLVTGEPGECWHVLRCCCRVRWHCLVPPGHPPQLPKEKEKNCHQGQATHNNYHCKEADGQVYRGKNSRKWHWQRRGGRTWDNTRGSREKRREKKRMVVRKVSRFEENKKMTKLSISRLIKWVFKLANHVWRKEKDNAGYSWTWYEY